MANKLMYIYNDTVDMIFVKEDRHLFTSQKVNKRRGVALVASCGLKNNSLSCLNLFLFTFSLISTSAVMNSAIMLATVTGTLNDQQNLSPSPLRPSCNSILHLFGLWLFEAAFIGTDLRVNSNSPKSSLGARGSVETSRDQPRTSSFTGGSSGVSSQTYSLPASEMEDLPPGLTPNK